MIIPGLGRRKEQQAQLKWATHTNINEVINTQWTISYSPRFSITEFVAHRSMTSVKKKKKHKTVLPFTPVCDARWDVAF